QDCTEKSEESIEALTLKNERKTAQCGQPHRHPREGELPQVDTPLGCRDLSPYRPKRSEGNKRKSEQKTGIGDEPCGGRIRSVGAENGRRCARGDAREQ